MIITIGILIFESSTVLAIPVEEKEKVITIVEEIFNYRNKGILYRDVQLIDVLYDKGTKYGTWAFEYEEKKMKYLHNWSEKQGI